MTLNGQTFGQRGITAASLTLSTWGVDSLSVTTNESWNTSDQFSAFQQVTLNDGGSRFTGWLDQAPKTAAGSTHGKTYTFTGPWRWPERINFEKDDTVANFGGIILSYDHSDPVRRLTLELQLDEIINFANSAGASIANAPSGGIFAAVLPREYFQNITCAAALQQLMGWAPAWALTADGGTTLTWRDTLNSTSHNVQTLTAHPTDLRLNPRYDLLRSSVRIKYQRSQDGFTFTTEDTATGGGAGLGADREELYIHPLDPDEFTPGMGIAEEYLRWAGKLQIETSITNVGDLLWNVLPGHRVNFSGLMSQWSGHDAVIQQIERDLFGEYVTFTTGPRRHLGLDQLIALRRRKIAGAQNPGVGNLPAETCVDGQYEMRSIPAQASHENMP